MAFVTLSTWGNSGDGPDELGIDQGPIVIMIENFRTQKVWRLFMQNEEVKRGLQRAGFVSLASLPANLQGAPSQNELTLSWGATAGRTYQVEYSQGIYYRGYLPGPVKSWQPILVL